MSSLIAIVTLAVVGWVTSYTYVLGCMLLAACLCIGPLTAKYWPPAIVLLATTSLSTNALFTRLRFRLYNDRSVSLLLDEALTPGGSGLSMNLHDNWRTINPDDWKGVVRRLTDVTLVIVTDLRREGKELSYEIEQLFKEPSRLQKTVFLVGDKGECPALLVAVNERNIPLDETVRLSREAQVLDAVDHELLTHLGDVTDTTICFEAMTVREALQWTQGIN